MRGLRNETNLIKIAFALWLAIAAGSAFAKDKDGFVVRPFYLRTQTDVSIEPSPERAEELGLESSLDSQVSYATFSPWEIGLELDYAGLAASYTVDLPRTNAEIDKRGKTTRESLEIFYTHDWFALEVFKDDIEGFYRSYDHPTYGSTPAADADGRYAQFADMRVENAGVNFTYVNDHENFTLPGRISGGLPQSSGDSLLVTAEATRHLLTSPTPLATEGQREILRGDADITGFEVEGHSLMLGYGFTLIAHDLFLSASVALGSERQRVRFSGVADDGWEINNALRSQYLLGAGYDTENIFLGCYGSFGIATLQRPDAEITVERSYIDTYVGWRF